MLSGALYRCLPLPRTQEGLWQEPPSDSWMPLPGPSVAPLDSSPKALSRGLKDIFFQPFLEANVREKHPQAAFGPRRAALSAASEAMPELMSYFFQELTGQLAQRHPEGLVNQRPRCRSQIAVKVHEDTIML